jgi:hypothetical protein
MQKLWQKEYLSSWMLRNSLGKILQAPKGKELYVLTCSYQYISTLSVLYCQM